MLSLFALSLIIASDWGFAFSYMLELAFDFSCIFPTNLFFLYNACLSFRAFSDCFFYND
jgi:hypothetical protein